MMEALLYQSSLLVSEDLVGLCGSAGPGRMFFDQPGDNCGMARQGDQSAREAGADDCGPLDRRIFQHCCERAFGEWLASINCELPENIRFSGSEFHGTASMPSAGDSVDVYVSHIEHDQESCFFLFEIAVNGRRRFGHRVQVTEMQFGLGGKRPGGPDAIPEALRRVLRRAASGEWVDSTPFPPPAEAG